MVQSLNTKALLTLASVVRRPSLLTPHVAVETISQVNYTALKEHCGIRAVIFDKDGQLCTTPTEPWIVFTAGLIAVLHVLPKLERVVMPAE